MNQVDKRCIVQARQQFLQFGDRSRVQLLDHCSGSLLSPLTLRTA